MNLVERWLRDNYGRQVLCVLAEYFQSPDSALNMSPLTLWFQFDGSSQSRISCAPDGWQILVDSIPPENIDMRSSGRTVTLDVSDIAPYRNFVGPILNLATLFGTRGSNAPIGFNLMFSSGANLIILNWGDELFVSNQMPNDAADDEDLVSSLVPR